MSKFKKYNRVVLTEDLPSEDLLEGETGMVVGGLHEEYNAYPVAFYFDNEDGVVPLHDCEGLVPEGNGLFIHEDEMRLI